MDIGYFRDGTNRTKLDDQYFHDNIGFTLPYLIVMVIALVLGILGNLLIVGTVMSSRILRTVGNMFIVNLAFADLSVSIIVDTFSIIDGRNNTMDDGITLDSKGIRHGEVFFEDKYVLCIVVSSICLTTCYCSLLSIGGISLNRMVHICYSEKYNWLFTYKKSICMILFSWTVSFMLQFPTLVGWGGHSYDFKTMTCVVDRTASFSYSAFWAFFGILTPWFLTAACYLKLFLHVRASKRKIQQMADKGTKQGGKAGRDKNESLKLMKTLFIIFIIFTLCWTPYAILLLVDFDDELPKEIHAGAVILAHLNSSMNCIIYGITNTRFRKGYRRFLIMMFCRRSDWKKYDTEETQFTVNPRTIAVTAASHG